MNSRLWIISGIKYKFTLEDHNHSTNFKNFVKFAIFSMNFETAGYCWSVLNHCDTNIGSSREKSALLRNFAPKMRHDKNWVHCVELGAHLTGTLSLLGQIPITLYISQNESISPVLKRTKCQIRKLEHNLHIYSEPQVTFVYAIETSAKHRRIQLVLFILWGLPDVKGGPIPSLHSLSPYPTHLSQPWAFSA